jgi:multiubiquitin
MANNDTSIEVEEVQVEEYGRRGGSERLPLAARYVIRVDKTTYPVAVSHMLGREILVVAGKVPPEDYKLTQKFHGGAAKTIGLDEDVDFRAPGVERFMTLKRDQTEG